MCKVCMYVTKNFIYNIVCELISLNNFDLLYTDYIDSYKIIQHFIIQFCIKTLSYIENN